MDNPKNWIVLNAQGRPFYSSAFVTREAAVSMAHRWSAEGEGAKYMVAHITDVVRCTPEEQDAAAPQTVTLVIKGKRHTYGLQENGVNGIEINLDAAIAL